MPTEKDRPVGTPDGAALLVALVVVLGLSVLAFAVFVVGLAAGHMPRSGGCYADRR